MKLVLVLLLLPLVTSCLAQPIDPDFGERVVKCRVDHPEPGGPFLVYCRDQDGRELVWGLKHSLPGDSILFEITP